MAHCLALAVRLCLRGALFVAAPVLLVGLLHAAPTWQRSERYTGTAHAHNGTQVLYREVHFVYEAQGEQRQLVVYQCPNGSPFARKLLHDSPTSTGPDFDFIDGRSGYREGVRGNGAAREVYVQRSFEDAEHLQNLPERSGGVIDAGFDTYVRANWDALGKSSATVPFLVPSRFGFMNVRLSGSVNVTDHGQPIRKLRMQLDTWYGFALPEIDLSYALANHRLWRFEGIGSIRDNQGRNQIVRIEFPADARQGDVHPGEVDAALAAPLVGRCDT